MKKLVVLFKNFHKPFLDSFFIWELLLFKNNDGEDGEYITTDDLYNDLSFFNIYTEEDFFEFYN